MWHFFLNSKLRRRYVAGMLMAMLSTSGLMAQQPVRVVSLNVCADQLLLELADPEQILALTHLATDPDAAFHHRRAVGFKSTQRTAEEVLTLEPTLVIAGSFGQDHTIAILQAQGLDVKKMPIAQSLEEVFENIARVGEWLGKQSQSESLVNALRVRLEQLPSTRGARPVAAIFDANGYTVGASSLRGQMLDMAGFDNLATHLGVSHYGKISLESLLARAPQVLIDSPYSEGTYSRGQALPKHPALRRSGLAPEVIPLPVNSTICAGPWTVSNIESLAKHRLRMQTSSP
ncbi:MAG: ABC transporter substrate-binding protein [Granulosicoccaceae bacterium]